MNARGPAMNVCDDGITITVIQRSASRRGAIIGSIVLAIFVLIFSLVFVGAAAKIFESVPLLETAGAASETTVYGGASLYDALVLSVGAFLSLLSCMMLVWIAVGTEQVTAAPGRIKRTHKALFIFRSKEYEYQRVKNIEVGSQMKRTGRNKKLTGPWHTIDLTLEGCKVVSMLWRLDNRSELNRIAKLIKKRAGIASQV